MAVIAAIGLALVILYMILDKKKIINNFDQMAKKQILNESSDILSAPTPNISFYSHRNGAAIVTLGNSTPNKLNKVETSFEKDDNETKMEGKYDNSPDRSDTNLLPGMHSRCESTRQILPNNFLNDGGE